MQLFFATVARNTLNERLAGLGQWNVVVVVVAAVVVRRLLISITSHRQRRQTSCQFNAVPISTLAIFLAVHSFCFLFLFFKRQIGGKQPVAVWIFKLAGPNELCRGGGGWFDSQIHGDGFFRTSRQPEWPWPELLALKVWKIRTNRLLLDFFQ